MSGYLEHNVYSKVSLIRPLELRPAPY